MSGLISVIEAAFNQYLPEGYQNTTRLRIDTGSSAEKTVPNGKVDIAHHKESP
jgi:hypothetical protein